MSEEGVSTTPLSVAESGFVSPLVENLTRSIDANETGNWLCAWCLNRVANERDRFQHGGNEFTFSNPVGIHFEIILFSQTLGCRQTGVPTLAHPWFAGHAWTICQCDRCGHHLGWYYSGPHQFAGLIKNRLVSALHIRN
jgi:hypothetical protein